MGITIQVLSTSVETKPTTKGSYQQLEVAYKNLTFQGKVEAKKLMSFGAGAESFKVLSTAKGSDVFEIETVKNDKGYIDWIKVTKGSANTVVQSAKIYECCGNYEFCHLGGFCNDQRWVGDSGGTSKEADLHRPSVIDQCGCKCSECRCKDGSKGGGSN